MPAVYRCSRMIVILNDNDMSIAPPDGRDERLPCARWPPARPISKVIADLRQEADAQRMLGRSVCIEAVRSRARWNTRAATSPAATLFDANSASTISARSTGTTCRCAAGGAATTCAGWRHFRTGARSMCVTQKGKGYGHGRAGRRTSITASRKFDVITGAQAKGAKPNAPSIHEASSAKDA